MLLRDETQMTTTEMAEQIRRLCECYDAQDGGAEALIGNANTLVARLLAEGTDEARACRLAVEQIDRIMQEEIPNERGFLWERP